MTISIGLDIGGTKIAGAAFDSHGAMICQQSVPTPKDYDAFIKACASVVAGVELRSAPVERFGVCIAGMIDQAQGAFFSVGISCAREKAFRDDLAAATEQEVRIANDADSMALAEAIDGAGKGYSTVLGLIIGTGIGSGFVVNQKIVSGPNGLVGEVGHLPLPYREESDGVPIECGCGQVGCIETTVAGSALMRLYAAMTGKKADNPQIATLARSGDEATLAVLDHYYEMLAKAMVTVIHAYDPHIIVVSGGLNGMPDLYKKVPQKWGKYCIAKNPKTLFVPAVHGPVAGLRGAAGLWG
ncbi:MAG: ROK family protein [Bdellovibrionales bacterium]|jgi:fructokinase